MDLLVRIEGLFGSERTRSLRESVQVASLGQLRQSEVHFDALLVIARIRTL